MKALAVIPHVDAGGCAIMLLRTSSSDKITMSPSATSACVTVPDHVLTRVVGQSTVLLDIETGRSFALDSVGSRVWALLSSLGSVQAVFEALASEFDADEAELENDLRTLVTQLADNRLIILDDHAA